MEANEIKCIHTGKEEIKVLVCDMILYIENPRESTKNLLELISEFYMVARYKINIQWSFVFLLIYSSNEQAKIEIKKTFPFSIAPKT